MFSSVKRKLFCEKSYFMMQSKLVEIVKEVESSDLSPAVIFFYEISLDIIFCVTILTPSLLKKKVYVILLLITALFICFLGG